MVSPLLIKGISPVSFPIQQVQQRIVNTSLRIINYIPHQNLPLPVLCQLHKHQIKLFHGRSKSPSATICRSNIGRLYARRYLDTLNSIILARQSATYLESATLSQERAKPLEWSIPKDYDIDHFGTVADQLGKSKLQRFWASGSRIFNLALLASPLLVLVPLAKLSGKDSKVENVAWEYGLWSIEKAGPTLIKLVQWATTRSDLFPAEFCSRFSKLQDSTRGHSWEETHRLLSTTLGPSYKETLQFMDKTPIGSGCVAQVYRAKLLKSVSLLPKGTLVAVKVQHPNIFYKVCADFYILSKITKFLENHVTFIDLEYLSLSDSVQEFKKVMLPQLDLRVEARNLTRFRRDFSGDDTVEFPLPLHELTNDQILVESFVHGEPILNYTKENHSEEDKQELAKVGLEAVMKMIFLYDFVHGDLHPGNIIVDRNKKNNLRMNMIDCGLVVQMGEREHKNLVSILGALIKKDGYAAGKLMVDTSKKCRASPMDVQIFCEGLNRICTDDEENNFLEKVGDYLAEICYLACNHKVKLEASFINAALACEIMEGIASSLYPTMRVQESALPMVLKAEVMHGLRGISFPKLI